MSNSDMIEVIQRINSNVKDLNINMLQISDAMNKMTQKLTELSDSFNQIVLIAQKNDVEIGCIEPWYEPCPENPNICVHTQLPPELKKEVCDNFDEFDGNPNAVIHMSESIPLTVGDSKFKITEQNFPVGHVAGDKTVQIPHMDMKFPVQGILKRSKLKIDRNI